MGEMVTRTWDGTSIPFQHQGAYAAYLPAPVAGWRPSFPTETENAASRASIELMRYQFECTDSAATDWVVYHAEGMASSTMEGVHAPLWRVAQAECLPGLRSPTLDDDLTAAANVQITSEAVRLGADGVPLTVNLLCDMNAQLMARSPKQHECGRLRISM